MSKIQIICTRPGMLRAGIAHPASAFYPAERWSEEDLKKIKADPAFVVREVEDTESTTTDADFELRVAAEVERRILLEASGLQAKFDDAVAKAVEVKVAEVKDDYEKQLAELRAQLAAAEAKSTKPAK